MVTSTGKRRRERPAWAALTAVPAAKAAAVAVTENKTKKEAVRAASHRDLYAPKRIFSRNTASKNHGRRQPCRDFFLCLAKKSLALECVAVLRERFFLTGAVAGRRNTVCILRPRRCLWGKRFPQNRVNPYVRPPKADRCYLSNFRNGVANPFDSRLDLLVSNFLLVGHRHDSLF